MPRHAKGVSQGKIDKGRPGRYGDGGGLYLNIESKTSKYWTFRYVRSGRMREMGLGRAIGHDAVSLSDARKAARELWDIHKAGRDPLVERRAGRSRLPPPASAAVGPSSGRPSNSSSCTVAPGAMFGTPTNGKPASPIRLSDPRRVERRRHRDGACRGRVDADLDHQVGNRLRGSAAASRRCWAARRRSATAAAKTRRAGKRTSPRSCRATPRSSASSTIPRWRPASSVISWRGCAPTIASPRVRWNSQF